MIDSRGNPVSLLIPGRSTLVQQAPPRQHRAGRGRAGSLPRELFPEAGESSLPAVLRGHRGLSALAGAAVLAMCAAALVFRVVPLPAWDTVYAEDLSIFLIGGLSHPWRLLTPYAGYLQFLPRVIGQFVALLPLRYAAAAFSVIGALIASGCALFVFHASAGHIRSATLRAVLALTIVLLPVAPLEIIDSGVNTPWYLLFALLWASLWRPRTGTGVAGAAAIGFLAASSDPLAVLFAPLLAIRFRALPWGREQAVTMGWGAGCLLQLPVIHAASAQHQSRVGTLEPLTRTLPFYAHDVVLPALGWHVAWRLQSLAGRNGATLIVAVILACVLGWAAVTGGRRVRLLVLGAVLLGFAFTIVAASISAGVTAKPVTPTGEAGSRYTTLPIFLFYAAAIVAVDAFLQRARAKGTVAVVVLVAVLAVGWVTDYRYTGNRSRATVWAPVASRWLTACADSASGTITIRTSGHSLATLPCANLRR